VTLRVIQWATGPVGVAQLREIVERPDLDLAGVLVDSPAKAGLDAGELNRPQRKGSRYDTGNRRSVRSGRPTPVQMAECGARREFLNHVEQQFGAVCRCH
jgi:hypothetical protein